MTKLSAQQRKALATDITVFLLDHLEGIVCSEKQVLDLMRICLKTDYDPDYSLGVHLYHNQMLRDYFEFARKLVQEQVPGGTLFDLKEAGKIWFEELHPELVPIPTPTHH